MSDAYLGEIRIFGGNFAPNGWMFCNGQLLPISRYTQLFSVIGIQYGGNGTTNFALPDLQGTIPVGPGAGPGLTPRFVGETGGSASVTLLPGEMPMHTHLPMGYAADGTVNAAANNVWAQTSEAGRHGKTPINLFDSTAPNVQMSPVAIGTAGSGAAHNNMQPFLALNFIICMDGIFPSRS